VADIIHDRNESAYSRTHRPEREAAPTLQANVAGNTSVQANRRGLANIGLFIHAVSARPTGEATALHAYQLDTRSVDQVGLAFSLILTAANLGSGGAVSYQSSAKI